MCLSITLAKLVLVLSLICICTILCSSSSSTTANTTHCIFDENFQHSNNGTSSRVKDIIDLLQSYKARHSIQKLREESINSKKEICSRSFMINFQFDLDCRLIGNHLLSFLNALETSVITDHTMVVKKKPQCSGYLTISDWMVTLDDAIPLLQAAGCYEDGMFNQRNPIAQAGTREWHAGDGKLRVSSADDLFNTSYQFFMSIILKHIPESLSSEYVARIKILFSNPYYDVARYESFGLLFLHAFSFSKEIVELVEDSSVIYKTEPLLCSMKSPIMIGAHMRHPSSASLQKPELDIIKDTGFEKALLHLNNSTVKHDNFSVTYNDVCIVAIASDRPASYARLIKYAASIGCKPNFIEKNFTKSIDKTAPKYEDHYDENGPWIHDHYVVADIYLLSHSSTYFIGSKESSYSAVIASIVSARYALAGHEGCPLIWVEEHGSMSYAWQPIT